MALSEQDLYPSRVSPTAQIVPRCDPVVHGGPDFRSRGPLDEEQVNEYENRGFLVLPEFLPPEELSACLDELEWLRSSEQVKNRPGAIIEPDSRALRSLFAVHQVSDYFRSLAADARVAGVAQQLLGSDVYLHQSRINLKPGFTGKEFSWHSDFETWHVEDGMPRMRACSFSLLLTPNYEFNGPLLVLPGSHRRYVTCIGETPEKHFEQSLRKQEYGVPDHDSLAQLVGECGIESCTGPAGTLVIFECNLMHGSNGNISPFPRSNLFLVYNSVENRLNDPYCGLEPRPEFIATRETFEPIRVQNSRMAAPVR